jgi:hypothetical protein
VTISVGEFVGEFVDGHPTIRESITREQLRDIWSALIPGESDEIEIGYEVFEDIFLRSISAKQPAGLDFRLGGWVLNVSEGLLKTSIVGAILAGLLAVGKFPDLPALVLPTIIPFLFEPSRVRLTQSERNILAVLTLREDVRSRKHAPDVLFEMLPPEIRRELSRLDFMDFLEKCHSAGVADIDDDETALLRPVDTARFRITVQ